MTETQIQAFLQLAGAMSPENLHCEGEISRTAADLADRARQSRR